MKLRYRPEIDGLRAIAIISVIFYHSRIAIFGGGFIGVDIFFVISGYLITSIILNELVTTGTFIFKNFYEKRIRRILPALIFVMLVSLPFAWIYLLPSSFIDFSKSILYSLSFSSNFYFHYSDFQYGNESGLFKPFLHTWSLSVEEQYYILFPIILFFTFKYFRKYLIHILILGLVISLGAADWGSRIYPSFNFYTLPTRGWELLSGSILAYFEITIGHRSRHKTLNLIMPSIGIFLIGHSILFFNDQMFHPSFYTLSPIIGVCLVIWFTNKDEFITKILSSKLFVGIGLISYSLYLWHYPIFAFSRISESTHGNSLLIAISTIFLSIISYYLIEKPARNKKNRFRNVLILIILFSFIIISINLNIIQKSGYKARIPKFFNENFLENPYYLLKNSDGKNCINAQDGCQFNTISNKKVYAIGDSHMGTLLFYLKNKIVKKNYQFITSTRARCFYFPGFDQVSKKTNKIINQCNNNYFINLKKNLSKETNSIFLFYGRLPLYLDNHYFDNEEGGIEGNKWDEKYVPVWKYDTIQNSFKNEVLELSKKNYIILIYPHPEAGWNVPVKLFNSLPNNFSLIKDYLIPKNYITTSYRVYKNRTKSSFELLDSIQGDNIYRVYPHKLFCGTWIKYRCVTHDDKNIFYFDDDHLSTKGAEMINDLIMKEIAKIELKSN